MNTADMIGILVPVQTKEAAFKPADNIRIKGKAPDWLMERLRKKPKEPVNENKI